MRVTCGPTDLINSGTISNMSPGLMHQIPSEGPSIHSGRQGDLSSATDPTFAGLGIHAFSMIMPKFIYSISHTHLDKWPSFCRRHVYKLFREFREWNQISHIYFCRESFDIKSGLFRLSPGRRQCISWTSKDPVLLGRHWVRRNPTCNYRIPS